jgi:hypothetical protein
MKKTITLTLATSLALGLMSFGVVSSNGITGRTTTGCSCHSPSANNAVTVSLTSPTSTLFSTGYVSGTIYTLAFTVAETGQPLFGMDLKASAGTLLAGVIGDNKKSGTEIVHTGTGNSTLNTHTFTFTWTAPTSGTVTFSFAGNATNANGIDDTGDHWNKGTIAVSPSTGISEKINSSIQLSVFPNPVSESANLTYELSENSIVSASLINVTGQVVATFFNKEEQVAGIQNRKLALDPTIVNGIYFIALNVNGKGSYTKIVIE